MRCHKMADEELLITLPGVGIGGFLCGIADGRTRRGNEDAVYEGVRSHQRASFSHATDNVIPLFINFCSDVIGPAVGAVSMRAFK